MPPGPSKKLPCTLSVGTALLARYYKILPTRSGKPSLARADFEITLTDSEITLAKVILHPTLDPVYTKSVSSRCITPECRFQLPYRSNRVGGKGVH